MLAAALAARRDDEEVQRYGLSALGNIVHENTRAKVRRPQKKIGFRLGCNSALTRLSLGSNFALTRL